MRIYHRKGSTVKYQEMRDRIPIDRNRLDDALEEHPFLILECVSTINKINQKLSDVKDQYEEYEAVTKEKIREKLIEERAKWKPSNSEVQERFLPLKETQELLEKIKFLKEDLADWETIKEALDARSRSLHELTELYVASYFSPNGRASERRKVSDKDYEEAKDAMTRSRRE